MTAHEATIRNGDGSAARATATEFATLPRDEADTVTAFALWVCDLADSHRVPLSQLFVSRGVHVPPQFAKQLAYAAKRCRKALG